MHIRSASRCGDDMAYPCTPANWMDVLMGLIDEGYRYLFVEVEADHATRLATGCSTHTLMKCVRPEAERPRPPVACPSFGHDYGYDCM